ncbi:hypothetical protein FGG08_006969 [Glutinoglossum americanum]|uniref:Uncharacterized protein n=1 Tax=Glutinoglossum americanum TaxID=1670608 RepID=A0A9P8HZS3_9PEZI|nr:hypothetical protein FGG08_006969 [Glutinoglossum americanum]
MKSSAITWLALLRAFAPTLAFADANPLPAVTDQPKFYFPRVVKRMIYTNTTSSETSTSEQERVPLTVTSTNDLESFFSSLSSDTTTGALANTTTTPTPVAVDLPGAVSTVGDTVPILPPIATSADGIAVSTLVDGGTSTLFTPGVIPGFTPGVVPTSTTDTPAITVNPDSPAAPAVDSLVPGTGGIVPVLDASLPTPPSTVAPGIDSPAASSATDLPTAPLTALVPDISLPTIPSITDIPAILSVDPLASSTSLPDATSTTDVPVAPLIVPLVSDTAPAVPSVDPLALGTNPPAVSTTDLPTAPIIIPLVSDTGLPVPVSSTDVPVPLVVTLDTGIPSALPSTVVPITDLPVPTLAPTTDTALVPTVTDPAVPATEPAGATTGITGPATGSDGVAATTYLPTAPTPDAPAVITSAPTKYANDTTPSTDGAPVKSLDIATGDASDASSLSGDAPQTIMPTATDTATSQWLPPLIVTQTDAPSTLSDASPTQTGIPSGLPKAIAPNGGVPSEPRNTTMIQIGFIYKIPYPFVVASSITAAQIFNFLPKGIAYDLGIPEDQVTMRTLEPYDTSKDLGYVTTLALAYIPVDLVDQLALDLHTPYSNLYKNPDTAVSCLMDLINPSFPILAGQGLASNPSNSAGGDPQASSGAGEGSVFSGGNPNSGPINIKTMGIGLTTALGSVAYVAAIFVVARRYKKRRQRHQRSSSLSSVIGEREGVGSGPLMGGGLAPGDRETPGGRATPGNGRESRGSRGSGRSGGNSARTQNISAPMMAENSLGWN